LRDRIITDLITRNWDDLLRVAGSLKLGAVTAHDLMSTFQGSGRILFHFYSRAN
jgi:TnpA family transposase